MEFLQLKYFYESAKHESFAKTAEIYMVPTTSVSASVRRLEKELGCSLFDRSANRIFLNKNGIRLKNALSVAFLEIENAVADIAAQDDGREIRILVRAIRSDITEYIIEYNEKHPKTTFKTVFDFNETEYEKYDVVIDREDRDYHGYSSFKLCDMSLRLKVAKSNTAAVGKTKLSELSNAHFISWGEQSNMHEILVEACQKEGFYPSFTAVSNDKECYEKLLRAGVGIGLGREDPKNDLPHLTYLPPEIFNEKYSVLCYYHSESCYGSVKGFVDFLKTKMK